MQEVKVLVEQLAAGEGDVATEFVCKICQVHLVGCKPKLTTCSHLFCGDCLSKWFEMQPGSQSWACRARGACSVPCPACKEPLRLEDLHEVCPGGEGGSDFLWKMLAATQVVCANHPRCNSEGKCTWRGGYGAFQAHIQSCSNEPLDADECSEALPAAAQPTSEPSQEATAIDSTLSPCSSEKEVADTDGEDGRSRTESSPISEVSTALPTAASRRGSGGSEPCSEVEAAPEGSLTSLIAQLVELGLSLPEDFIIFDNVGYDGSLGEVPVLEEPFSSDATEQAKVEDEKQRHGCERSCRGGKKRSGGGTTALATAAGVVPGSAVSQPQKLTASSKQAAQVTAYQQALQLQAWRMQAAYQAQLQMAQWQAVHMQEAAAWTHDDSYDGHDYSNY